MIALNLLFDNNAKWAAATRERDPQFFERLAREQTPEFLWIGCSDSRLPAEQVMGLMPGEVFVHRNIANIVSNSDINCMSVLQYAVDVLHVRHIIVAGHYGCGGVKAALDDSRLGLVEHWLGPVREVVRLRKDELNAEPDPSVRLRRLCEANVIAQVKSTVESAIVRDAWAREQELAVHGWIYDLHDGLLRDLKATAASRADADRLSSEYVANRGALTGS